VNTVSLAMVGGFPLRVYGLSVLIPADTTAEPCWILTLSGYKDMWAKPAVVLSGGMGFNIRLAPRVSIRPAVGVGDFGFSEEGGESYGVATIHLDLWAEVQVSDCLAFVGNIQKRFDISYRHYSPWGVAVGIRVSFEPHGLLPPA